MAFCEDMEAFVVHISFLSLKSRMTIELARKTQIALLLAKKFIVPAKYSDFAAVLLEELANVLPKQTEANEHTIKLEQGK